MANDLLFEIGTEELPSGSVWPLAEALMSYLVDLFAKEKITHGESRFFATPRRLAVLIESVADVQPDQPISKRGPALSQGTEQGQPSKALIGFAKSCGVTPDALTTVTTDKGAWWVYEAVQKGRETRAILPGLLQEVVAKLPVTKGMRWGDGDVLFARPVHWVLLLLGHEIIDAEFFGVKTGRHSFGHRFHSPQAIVLDHPRQYEQALQQAFVVADFAKRRDRIVAQIEAIALEQQKHAIMPDALLDEVTSIVEWPCALLAQFDARFLDVPKEALIAAMQSHQKSFALCDDKQQLTPYFITVANIESKDAQKVVLGNEKVMRARLSDAAFFFKQDKKFALCDRIESTKHVVFQAKLGSLFDKANRLVALMSYFTTQFGLDSKHAIRAAELSKCDLMTGMVGEFPELQGLMGFYYALHDKEDSVVAIALNEQYMPRFAKDDLPNTPLGSALSLADRMDTLVGAFAMGQKPTGVKDPFKLRRHALAVVRILIATPTPCTLSAFIAQALKGYGYAQNAMLDELKPFILDRMFAHYQALGVPSSMVQAVLARQDDWLYDAHQRIMAMASFTQLPNASRLASACKRVTNLLQSYACHDLLHVDESLLEELAEQELLSALRHIEESTQPHYQTQAYEHILNELAMIQHPLDQFFEKVMVMVEDERLRNNRLCLLARVQRMLHEVADISLLQVG